MAHSHFGARLDETGPQPLVDPDELRRHRRALRILVVVLIPLAVWTLAGLIVLWPGNISAHVNEDVAGYSVAGVTYPKARISKLTEISCDGLSGSTPGVSTTCANATVTLLEGDDNGKAVDVPLTAAVYSSGVEDGQVIRLVRVPPADGQPAQYQFSDFERRTPLIAFALIFAAVVIAVARWRGFASLIGLGFAAFIMVKFMFPALVAGTNPLAVGLIGSSAIMFVVLYAAHGFSARTSTALVGTLFGLVLIAALGYVASRWAHLTGVASEEDFVLAAAAPDLRLTSVVLCGIIVAGLGVLNDVTITQASAVWELADADSRSGKSGRQSQRHIFTRAMRIGRDHIASTVYTIVFATAGASLSVLLLISIYDRPLLQVLQTEQFAGEVVRILVGSIGLVLAVPLTTAIGAAVVRVSGSATPAGDSPSERTAAATGSASRDEDTTVLPKTKWRDLGQSATGTAADSSTTPAEPATASRRRRSRRRDDDDDFGDFTYLHEPGDTDPGPRKDPGSRGRSSP